MTEYAELIERLKPHVVVDAPMSMAVSWLRRAGYPDAAKALNDFILENNALKSEARTALSTLIAERDEARANEWPFGKRPNPVKGHTSSDFAVYGDEKSIDLVSRAIHELKAMAPARVERIQQETARAQAAEARAEKLEKALRTLANGDVQESVRHFALVTIGEPTP